MQDLSYFEKMAEVAIFNAEAKKINEDLGEDSLSIRIIIANKNKFADTTKVVNFESRK